MADIRVVARMCQANLVVLTDPEVLRQHNIDLLLWLPGREQYNAILYQDLKEAYQHVVYMEHKDDTNKVRLGPIKGTIIFPRAVIPFDPDELYVILTALLQLPEDR